MPDGIKEKKVESGSIDFIEGIDKVKFSTPEEANKAMLDDLNELMSFIARAKKEWEGTVDSFTDPLFIHDREFKIIRCNRAYRELAGSATFKELIGRLYFEVFPKMEGPFRMHLKANEEEISVPAINRIFKVRFYSLRDTDGTFFYSVYIMEDVTEVKRAEDRLRQEIEVTRHLLMIAEATAQLTDLDKFMAKAVHCVRQITVCDICLSYLWDDETRLFRPCEEVGLSQSLTPYYRTESIMEDLPFIRKAIEAGFEVIENITIDDSRLKASGCGLFRLIKDIDRFIVIPLTSKDGYRGLLITICVGSGTTDTAVFTERDKELVRGIAYQVSIGLMNAILYKNSINRTIELSRKIETIQVMHEIDRSILSTLDPQEIIETVVIMLSRIIYCDLADVMLADYEKKGFCRVAGFGTYTLQKGEFVPFENTSAAAIIKTGKPQYIANLKEIKGRLPLEESLLEEGFLSSMRVPLTVKGDCIGVLSIGVKRLSAFTPDDLSTLEKLSSQVSVALENSRLIQDVEDLFISTVRALSNTIDAKSQWTKGHSERVTKIAIDIGKEMGFEEKALKKLEMAGLLHDIGKIGTCESILDKPGELTGEELNIIRQHSRKGADILEPIKQLKEIIKAIRHHHEFYDGNGYPDGLKGEEISLTARILTVADTVDAMGTDRPYRKGRSMEEIIAELKRCSGYQFDPKVVEAFLHIK